MKFKMICLHALLLLVLNNGFSQKPHPAWSFQSNVYEVNLRQYSASGSIKDFEKHLPRLKNMGVEILWFMPVTPIGIEGRKWTKADLGSYYAVRNYKAFNEEFGTMKNWIAFVKRAHSMGFKVIVDWVANHSAPDNIWMKTHPQFYERDKNGNTVYDADYTDTRNLDYTNKELRDSMVEAMKFWVKVTDIDGFRCDVADGVPIDFWKHCITSLKKIKNVFMLAESEKHELHEAGFDQTYAWSLMAAMKNVYTRERRLAHLDSVLNENFLIFPKDAFRLYFTTNHDENSWNGTEFEKYGDAYEAFAVLTQTMYQSVPLIYSGQEVPNKKRLKFFVKDTIEWGSKFEMAPFYKTLLKLRKSTPALAADASYKKLITANDVAIFAYTREKEGRKVAVVLNLSGQPQSFTIKEKSIYGKALNVFTGKQENLSSTKVYTMEPWGYFVYDYK